MIVTILININRSKSREKDLYHTTIITFTKPKFLMENIVKNDKGKTVLNLLKVPKFVLGNLNWVQKSGQWD